MEYKLKNGEFLADEDFDRMAEEFENGTWEGGLYNLRVREQGKPPIGDMFCFHNPDEQNGFLSNWYMSDFEVDGVRYSSLEQYMMHMKAILFGDVKTAEKIMATKDPSEIKALGRSVAPFDSTIWAGRAQIIVYRGLLAKFGQDKRLARMLEATGDAMLVECAGNDKVWACGRTMDDPRRHDIALWRGKNLLGFTLMEVRGQLRNERRP